MIVQTITAGFRPDSIASVTKQKIRPRHAASLLLRLAAPRHCCCWPAAALLLATSPGCCSPRCCLPRCYRLQLLLAKLLQLLAQHHALPLAVLPLPLLVAALLQPPV